MIVFLDTTIVSRFELRATHPGGYTGRGIASARRREVMDLTTALQATRGWPAEERLEFALRLWDELVENGWKPEPDEELTAELDKRLDAHEANPSSVRTSEQVWERVRITPP